MKKRYYYYICIGILGLLIIILGLFFLYPKQKAHTQYHIILREDGFHPQTLVIPKGAAVTFTSQKETFWPASASHPLHTHYPEFDPKRLLGVHESWEFIFNKTGTWLYHDHIHPGYVGTIVVYDNAMAWDAHASLKNNCLTISKENKLACWNAQLETALSSVGLDAAFDVFKTIYSTDPDIPKSCHEWGHKLGEAAFNLYKHGQKISFRKEMGFCGYGFFHGFLEKLTADTGNVVSARKWCESFVEESNNNSTPWDNCVHGIGHGTTARLLEYPENWGDFQKVADMGLSSCEKTFQQKDRRNCYDGVFNELNLDIFNSQYNFNFNQFVAKKDPFWHCRRQQERHKESCYFEFIGMFWKLFDFDLNAAMKYVVDNVENLPVRGPSAVTKLSADFMQFDIVNSDHQKNIAVCRTVPQFLFAKCLAGIINGFVQHGEPENIHVRALNFCGADYLTQDEQDYCHSTLIVYLRVNYTADKMREACRIMNVQYQNRYCQDFQIDTDLH